MNTAVSVPSTAVKLHDAGPSFVGIVRGELFKVSRQLATWIFAVLYVGGIGLTYLIDVGTSFKDSIGSEPTWAIYKLLGVDMMVLKIFGGAFIILIATRLIGMEYSGGTIRVLLSRGVGRLQLLFGKLAALTIIALILVAVTLLLDLLLTVILLLIAVGNINLLTSAPSGFWADSWTHLLLALVSLGVTLLMATAVTVLSRSLTIGMAVGMLWYPAENMAIIFLILGYRLTNSDFWRLLSGDFLGLNLNAMPAAILPERAVASTNVSFSAPLVPVTGGHTLLVVAIFAVVFAAVSIILTARRDVKE